jgi:hypothetical protein
VLCVTPPVKLSNLPTTPLAERSMPPTTVLANAAPGSVGSVTWREPRDPRALPEAVDRPLPRAVPEAVPRPPPRALRTIGTQGR